VRVMVSLDAARLRPSREKASGGDSSVGVATLMGGGAREGAVEAAPWRPPARPPAGPAAARVARAWAAGRGRPAGRAGAGRDARRMVGVDGERRETGRREQVASEEEPSDSSFIPMFYFSAHPSPSSPTHTPTSLCSTMGAGGEGPSTHAAAGPSSAVVDPFASTKGGFTLSASDAAEPILRDNPDRFILLPITYPEVWAMYKKAEASFWTGGLREWRWRACGGPAETGRARQFAHGASDSFGKGRPARPAQAPAAPPPTLHGLWSGLPKPLRDA